MTLIAVSIPIDEPDGLVTGLELARDAAGAGAGLVEWRIDALAEWPEAADVVHRLIAESPLPVIVTCRPHWEGGACTTDELTRIDLLERAMAANIPPRYVDLELAAFVRDPDLAARLGDALNPETGLIVSSHDFDGRPADLLQRIEMMAAVPSCAVVKLAWTARSLRDNLEAFELLQSRPKPMIALCMGRFGLPSRLLGAKYGALITFASHDAAPAMAPGQIDVGTMIDRYRVDRVGSDTAVFGVVGWPVDHSRGPELHNRAFAAAGIDAIYLPMPIADDYLHFKATVGAFIDTADLTFRGASVTIPHKQNLLTFIDERGGCVDDLTRRIGAANTLVVGDDGELSCANTDAPAAVQAVSDLVGAAALVNTSVAVLGSGGVGRAVAVGFADAGANVAVFNRTAARAHALADELAGLAVGRVTAPTLTALSEQRFDLIINATPIGMTGGPAPDASPLGVLGAEPIIDDGVIVFDTVYTPLDTRLLIDARARGARTINGMELFTRQADRQFRLWTGAGMPPGVVDAFA